MDEHDLDYADWIAELTDLLEIDAVGIEFDNPEYSSFDGHTMHIKIYDNNLDTFFAIAHEMRHVWQDQHGIDLSASYAPGSIKTDVYNSQKHEIDSNAFASIVMSEYFHVSPKFESYSEDVKKKIMDRAEYLSKHGIDAY